MYRRRTKGKSDSKLNLFSSSSGSERGADIVAPNNTSLIVNRSKTFDDPQDELPKSVVASLYDGDDEQTESGSLARPSTSILNSMTQKQQSTPQSSERQNILSNVKAEVFSEEQVQNDIISSQKQQKWRLFLDTLAECGAKEIAFNGSFMLSLDQTFLSRKLNATIKDRGIQEEFLGAFKDYMNCNEKLEKMLLLTQTSPDCETARGSVQEPLLRILLGVDCIQPLILDILLEKIALIINEENMDLHDRTVLLSGILKQARWLQRIDNTKFASLLLDLVPGAPTPVRKEIVSLLPSLIVDSELPNVTSKLAKILQKATELTPVIIDTLGNLTMSPELQLQVRETLLSGLSTFPLSFLPSLVNFIVSSSNSTDLQEVVESLRKNLPAKLALMDGKSLIKLFGDLRHLLVSSKYLTTTWLKVVNNIKSSSDFFGLDLMILILIQGSVFKKKATTMTLLRNRIRSGILTSQCFIDMIQSLKVVVLINHTEFLNLGFSLLKTVEPSIAEVAILMLTQLFEIGDAFFRQEIVRNLVTRITSGTPSGVHNAITLLNRLRSSHLEELEPLARLIMLALSVLPNIELPMARQLVDVMANLITMPSHSDSGLLEELRGNIQKQLSAWQCEAQRRGVMAAVAIAKHSALQNVTSDLNDLDFLLKLAAGPQGATATSRGFFFDELATAIRQTKQNVPFLMTWARRIYHQAIIDVFVSDVELECQYFPMSLQYNMDSSGNLVFPIVSFIVNPIAGSYLNAETIPAAIRLLWSAEKDMDRIIPLVTAAVVLPDPSVFDNFLKYETNHQKFIMDSFYLCANFFIEGINALALYKTCKQMLVIRLKQLMEVRKLIQLNVGQIPGYVPPSCQFHIPVLKPTPKKAATKSSSRGKKRKCDGEEVNQSVLDSTGIPSTSTAAPSDAIVQVTTPTDDAILHLNGTFRELHCHVYKLLRMELKLNPTKVFKKKKMSDLIVVDVSWSYRPEDKPELGISDTLFLLQDYLVKSDLVLRERPFFLKKKPTGLVVESISPMDFVEGSVKLLPKLCLKLDVAKSYCEELLKDNNDACDAAIEMKLCFCAILKIFADLLSWPGFQNSAHTKIFNEILSILSRKNVEVSGMSDNDLASEATKYLASLGPVVPQLSAALHLTRTIQACYKWRGQADPFLVGELCLTFMKRKWETINGSPARGPEYNQNIEALIRVHLASVSNRLENIKTIAETCVEEIPQLQGKDSIFESFPSLTKGNFPILYRALGEALAAATSAAIHVVKNDDEKCIELWSTVTSILFLLVEISKSYPSRINLASLLKNCQSIIQVFLNKGLPVLESALRIKADDVLKVLKTLQVVTRYLHSVCCHSKLTSDTVIAAHVPKIRASCERLTLEVKGMLISNKIPQDCITIAVLKNRDLQGNDILSQTTVDNSDDEDQLPEQEVDPMEDEDISDDTDELTAD